jgi:uncharacterized phosphosugar-binding protein
VASQVDLLSEWYGRVLEVLQYIVSTQARRIDEAASIIAESIARGHVCFLFGSGHSAIPVMEMFPRYGSYLGFLPIVDLPLVSFLRIVGDMGYPQFDLLENSPEYGRRIVENYSVHEEDCAVVFSHSGTTPVAVEVALQFKYRGARIIGVTSLRHAVRARPRHPRGVKLHEIADVVIDTGVPEGDVSLRVTHDGRTLRVGPLSTVASVFVANALLLKALSHLLNSGYEPLVLPVRGFDPGAEEVMREVLRRYRELYSQHLAR